MTTQEKPVPNPQTTPPGATLHLGGQAYAHPDLAPLLYPIESLTPYPGNPRRGDQDAITASIAELGLYRAVIVQRSTGHVLAGNHTLRALVDLGADEAPVTWVDVDDTRAAAIVARDNRTSDLGGYDDADLLALLTADDDVLALTGYDDEDLIDLRRALANAAFVQDALAAGVGEPLSEVSDPIDTDGAPEKVTVTVEAGHRADLYALLAKQPWIVDVADAHTRRTA